MGFVIQVAFIIAPSLCLLGSYEQVYPFLILLALLGLILLLTYCYLTESFVPSPEKDNINEQALCAHLTSFSTVWTDQARRKVYWSNACCYLALCGFFRNTPIYFVEEFELDNTQQQLFMLCGGVAGMLTYLFILPRFSGQNGFKTLPVVRWSMLGIYMYYLYYD